jgi:hypothetical protein
VADWLPEGQVVDEMTPAALEAADSSAKRRYLGVMPRADEQPVPAMGRS